MADDWSARILLGDCVEAMAMLEAESIDAVCCDPPYGLEFMGKDWDKFSDRDLVTRTGHDRASSGAGIEHTDFKGFTLPSFGGKSSSYECAVCGVRDAFRKGCRCEGEPTWRAINPNGTAGAVAFQRFSQQWAEAAYRVLKPGGHLLAFGGTRTYHRMAVAIEDAGFEVRDSLHWIYGSGFPKSLDVSKAIDKKLGGEREPDVTDGREQYPGGNPTYGKGLGVGIVRRGDAGTPEAAAWDGWGTALKPAHEPIVLARKPLGGTVAENVLEFGVGGINVAGARIGEGGGTTGGPRNENWRPAGSNERPSVVDIVEIDAGRWPSNVLLSHLAECEGVGASHTDVLCAPGCPVAELNEMSGESTSKRSELTSTPGTIYGGGKGLPSHSGVYGVDDSGGAARFFYVSKPRTRERVGGTLRNLHPTVKPIDLMRYLVRLVTPPAGVVLDPFLGSGTTGCAAMAEGLRFVGIEQDPDSYETALARVSDYAFAHGRPRPVSA